MGGVCFTQRKMDVAIQVERRWRNIDEKAEGRYRGRGRNVWGWVREKEREREKREVRGSNSNPLN